MNSDLPQRTLGAHGPTVSALGFGCMGLNRHRSVVLSGAEATAVLLQAVDCGITLFDTAQVYGPLTNERLVGRVLIASTASSSVGACRTVSHPTGLAHQGVDLVRLGEHQRPARS